MYWRGKEPVERCPKLWVAQVMRSRWVRESKSKSTSQVKASNKSEVIEAQAALFYKSPMQFKADMKFA